MLHFWILLLLWVFRDFLFSCYFWFSRPLIPRNIYLFLLFSWNSKVFMCCEFAGDSIKDVYVMRAVISFITSFLASQSRVHCNIIKITLNKRHKHNFEEFFLRDAFFLSKLNGGCFKHRWTYFGDQFLHFINFQILPEKPHKPLKLQKCTALQQWYFIHIHLQLNSFNLIIFAKN